MDEKRCIKVTHKSIYILYISMKIQLKVTKKEKKNYYKKNFKFRVVIGFFLIFLLNLTKKMKNI